LHLGGPADRRRARRRLVATSALCTAIGLIGLFAYKDPFLVRVPVQVAADVTGDIPALAAVAAAAAPVGRVAAAPVSPVPAPRLARPASADDIAGDQLARLPSERAGTPPAPEPIASTERAIDVLKALQPQDEAATEAAGVVRTVAIGKGDTLVDALRSAGAEAGDAHAAAQALARNYDPKRLQIGQELTLVFDADAESGAARLMQVALAASVEKDVLASRDDSGGFRANAVDKPLERRDSAAAGGIDDSLYLAATRAGVPAAVVIELIRLYSYDVDFQRDIQPGDSFEVMYDSYFDEAGAAARTGEIQFARLTVGGRTLPLYRYELPDGRIDFFDEKGESARKFLMKTPVDGARLSSGFGMRRHPILGYSTMHRGVDFAAPPGTPIYAAGHGTVEMADWHGGYGRYVRIRHNGRFKTAYAHMSRFAPGIRSGSRVRQGQVIGFVGTTGRSTGPHLHYEVLQEDKQVNPLGLKLPTGEKLEGRELTAFLRSRNDTRNRFLEALETIQVAQGDASECSHAPTKC